MLPPPDPQPGTTTAAAAAPRAAMSRSGELQGRHGPVPHASYAHASHAYARQQAGTSAEHGGGGGGLRGRIFSEPRRVQVSRRCRGVCPRCCRLGRRWWSIEGHAAAASAGRDRGHAPIVGGTASISILVVGALGSRRSTAGGGYGLLHGCKMCMGTCMSCSAVVHRYNDPLASLESTSPHGAHPIQLRQVSSKLFQGAHRQKNSSRAMRAISVFENEGQSS